MGQFSWKSEHSNRTGILLPIGVKLNHNGNFTLALKQLSEKALHALYGTRRQLNFSRLNPKYAIKIFDSIISPILLYNSEVWGMS